MIKTSHVQNYLWGDEPRLLSFKAFLYKDTLNLALKYRTDKISKETAQTLLASWASHIVTANLNVTESFHTAPGQLYEASALQTNLWALLKNHPNGLPYTIPLLKRVNKNTDITQLEKALQKTIQNNPALRLSFQEHKQNLQWQIHSQVPIAIQPIITDNLYETLHGLLMEPISTEAPPLLKAYLLTPSQTNEDAVLLIRLHHLVCDGISAEYFLKELKTWYDNTDRKVPLSDRDEQYINQHLLEKSSYSEHLQHYTNYINHLNSLIPANAWMPVANHPPVFMGNVAYHLLPKDLSQKILSYCQKNHFSLYAFYLYVFCKALHELVRQEKLYISMVKSNRLSLKPQDAIGYYADNIPILVDMDSSDNGLHQIKRLQMTIIEFIEQYQHPFLARDLEKTGYKQPPFIFNQYKIDSQNELFQSADQLINELVEQGGKQVVLWNYINPEKLNLLVRSSDEGDLIGLVFNAQFFNADEANACLSYLLKQVNDLIR